MPTAKDLAEFEAITKSKPIKHVFVTGEFKFRVFQSGKEQALIEHPDSPLDKYSVRVVINDKDTDAQDKSIDSPFDLPAKYIIDNFWPYLLRDSTAYRYFLRSFPELCSPYITREEIAERCTHRYAGSEVMLDLYAQRPGSSGKSYSARLNRNHLFAHDGDTADAPAEPTPSCSSSPGLL
ncbi:hypothetical protein [Legionella sp. CNM-4043-24]|uniref:hypothetical protein n=1 Tax=Legionella sp. CNM-4043-24 TaxID=3421646 RepID=UPI00403AEEDA